MRKSLVFGSHRAHMAVHHAIQRGLIPRPTAQLCIDCGSPAVHYEHRNYSHPLDVVPACQSCNAKRGPGIPAGLPTYRQKFGAGYVVSQAAVQGVAFEAIDFGDYEPA